MQPAEYRIEVWAKLAGDVLYMAVRAYTRNWVAVLFKDFEHHGMIGDFNDAKVLSAGGVGDFFVAAHPSQPRPEPRRTAGVHT